MKNLKLHFASMLLMVVASQTETVAQQKKPTTGIMLAPTCSRGQKWNGVSNAVLKKTGQQKALETLCLANPDWKSGPAGSKGAL